MRVFNMLNKQVPGACFHFLMLKGKNECGGASVALEPLRKGRK